MRVEEDDVFAVVTNSPSEAVNLRLRAELMDAIKGQIAAERLTQREAAARAGVSDPRMSDLCREKIDKFSLDALVNISANLGMKVSLINPHADSDAAATDAWFREGAGQ